MNSLLTAAKKVEGNTTCTVRNGTPLVTEDTKERFSDFFPKDSIFSQNSYPLDVKTTEGRKLLIEPCDFITRLPIRSGRLGDKWQESSDPGVKYTDDSLIDEDVRKKFAQKGNLNLGFEAGHHAKGQDLQTHGTPCNEQNHGNGKPIIRQLACLWNEAKDATSAEFVCAENEFFTSAPYMAVKGSDVIYSVWYSSKGEACKWSSKDRKLGIPYTFGNFKKILFRLRIPHKLNTRFNNDCLGPLITYIGKLKEYLPTQGASIEGRLQLIDGNLYIRTPDLCNRKWKLVADLPQGNSSWPAHILQKRYFLSGAPDALTIQASQVPEINQFIAELENYKGSSTQSLQAKAWMVWCLEMSLEMYTAQRAGTTGANSGNFTVHEVDYAKIYRPSIHPLGRLDCSKGSGFSILKGNPHFDAICESLGLRGFLASPMVIANGLLYNRLCYGKVLGTPLGIGDAFFLYDYGGDRTMPFLRQSLEELRNQLSRQHEAGDEVAKLLIEISLINFEFIRAKKRYEDSMHCAFMKVRHICSWKDVRSLLHFRTADGAYPKAVMTSGLGEEGYLACGFAAVLHDLIDYGYDLRDCESSNTLYTLGAVDGSLSSLERVYALVLAGLKYLSRVQRYAASGLCSVGSHYWNLCNGRHRILNCAMSVKEHSHPPSLEVKDTLLGNLVGRKEEEFSRTSNGHDHNACLMKYNDLMKEAQRLGHAYPNLLKILVAKPYERIYGKALDTFPAWIGEVDAIPVIIDCACIDSSNEGIELMWDLELFMYDETAIMWHALLGTLLVVGERVVAEDRAGYGHEDIPWVAEEEVYKRV